MSSNPIGDVQHPYGLPMGTVRGFMSLLICSFFWIFLVLPEGSKGPPTAPLGHFFLLTLVFLSFASHHGRPSEFLPRLIRFLFVGGSIAVVAYIGVTHADRLAARLTPNVADIGQWPVLLGTLSAGFAVGILSRLVMGGESTAFQVVRGWTGIIAMLLLITETVVQFLVIPTLSDPPGPAVMKVWEGVVIAFTAAYFGTRA